MFVFQLIAEDKWGQRSNQHTNVDVALKVENKAKDVEYSLIESLDRSRTGKNRTEGTSYLER